MWEDLLVEFEKWRASGLATNQTYSGAKAYNTGYMGRRTNEEILEVDFNINKEKWIDMGKQKLTAKKDLKSPTLFLLGYFCADLSRSGGDQGIYDFKCATLNDDRTFVYHIIVSR